MNYAIPILMVVMANITYNICQKSTPSHVNPFVAMTVTYSVALGFCMIGQLFFPNEKGYFTAVLELNWTSYVLGIAIFFVEFGYLLAYRAGWNLSITALLSNVAVGICLAIIALFAFGESLKWTQYLGIGIAIAGICLMAHK